MNESQGNAMASESLSNSLLQVNKMLYKMPPSLGITARRHHVIDFSQQQSYSNGQTMVFDLQTGSYFIDGKNSYLKLTLTPNANSELGSGGATNILKRIVVRTKSGKEWCRCEEFNLYARNYLRYSCPVDYLTHTAKSYGYDITTGTANPPALGRVYCIPLWLIPCFNQDKLLPPQIMEGLRIELTLASAEEAFASGGAVSYTVTNAEIHSDAFDIADQFKRKVAEMSARQGLILVHKEYFHSNVGTIGATNTYNFDIKKACSKACRNFTVMRSSDAPSSGVDTMNAEQYSVVRYQAHVGQDYMPNQPITIDGTPNENNVNEAYYDTQFVWDKVNQCWYPNSISPENFLATRGMVAFNLNKSHVTDLDGYVLNNSRALVVDIQCTPTPVSRKLDSYLQHLRVAKVYTANAEIRD